ncbi:MAG: hypothetical protein C0425_02540 [Chlorobiaceae bacterium]|nr:hypothetical protein [Chlorobiaceae bacterium]MBA4309199.1 hypothetical protein [Chlorobiaceae bacterium]
MELLRPFLKINRIITFKKVDLDRKQRPANITYTQAGVSGFVVQENAKFKVQFFVGSSVVKIPPIANLQNVIGIRKTRHASANACSTFAISHTCPELVEGSKRTKTEMN